jgi:hypothetical protein
MVAGDLGRKAMIVALSALAMIASAGLGGCSTDKPPAAAAALNMHAHGGHCEVKAIMVPGTGMAIGANWGRMEPLLATAHRPWPAMQALYDAGVIKHNPVYLRDLDARQDFRGKNPSFGQEARGLSNIPWFYANLAITPVLMCIHPPLAEVCSVPGAVSPIYQGYLPLHGAVASVPAPGRIDWPYPVVHISGGSAPSQ